MQSLHVLCAGLPYRSSPQIIQCGTGHPQDQEHSASGEGIQLQISFPNEKEQCNKTRYIGNALRHHPFSPVDG